MNDLNPELLIAEARDWLRDGITDRISEEFILGLIVALEVATKPRTVATVEELDALPIGSVLLSDVGGVWERWKMGEWFEPASTRGNPAHHLALPATILYVPDSPPADAHSQSQPLSAESDTTGATEATEATEATGDDRGNGCPS